ncbi:unnamed protein product, partial [Pocillopora meandrina]
QGVSIGHSNVRGLRKNLPEVKILLQHTNLDILTISETHLTQDISDNEVNIDGYRILRRDRSHKVGGGVAIYFNISLDCVRISKYDNDGIEALWIELKAHSQRLLPFIKYVHNFKNVLENPKDFKHDLESAPWWVCSTFEDLDDITWAWNCMYNIIASSHIPLRKAKVRKNSLPWMNSEIRKEMNKRYKLLKACDGTPANKNSGLITNPLGTKYLRCYDVLKLNIGKRNLQRPRTQNLSGKL